MITLSLFQAEVLTVLVTVGLALAFIAGYIHAIDSRRTTLTAAVPTEQNTVIYVDAERFQFRGDRKW